MKIYTLGTSITSGGTLGNALHGSIHGAILNAADKG